MAVAKRNSAVNFLTQHWQFILLLILVLPFFTIRLAQAPVTWYDEGLNLNAIRTLAEMGIYGLTSSDGIRRSDPAIQTGTPVIVPLAVLHSLFGPNLALLRSVIVLSGLAFLITFYALTSRLYGKSVAGLATLLLVAMPGDTTTTVISLSRQILGEMPAALLICCGLLIISTQRSKEMHYGLAGLCFGAAITIKSQVLLILTPAVLLWSAYRLFLQPSAWRFLLPLTAAMIGVYGLDWMWRSSMALDQASANTSVLLEGIAIHILPFRFANNLLEPGVVVRLFIVIIGLIIFGLIRQRPSKFYPKLTENHRHTEVFLLIFVTLWIIWWAAVSIGWGRYAFIGFTFFVPLLAFVANWLWRQTKINIQNRILNSAILILTVPLIVFLVTRDWLFENRQGDKFLALIDYLKDSVPENMPIVTWEWSATYFTDHTYILPTTHDVNVMTRRAFLNADQDDTADLFDPLEFCPQYALLGSFQIDRAVMQPAIEVAAPEPIYDHTPYTLYRIPSENLQKLSDGTCTSNMR